MREAGRRRAEAAAADERRRVAVELHDAVAHGLTAISMQAAVLRTLEAADRRQDVEATIDVTARQSLIDLRRLLAALRGTPRNECTGGPDAADVPVRLSECTARLEAAGYVVRAELEGVAALPASLRLTVLHVTQEAVANVVRHGPGTGTVLLSARSAAHEGLALRVDSPLAAAAGPGGAGQSVADAGFGLLRMGERVALFDGRLRAGPEAGERWVVHAVLPTR